MMENTSLFSADIDTTKLDDLKIKVAQQYGLIVQGISTMDCSFERALSVCLFGHEDEAKSISSTLHSQYDWSTHDPLNQNQLYIMLASEIYGVTIQIHEAHSERVYQTDDDCPVVHLVQLKSVDECCIYLPTQRDLLMHNDHQNGMFRSDIGDTKTSDYSDKSTSDSIAGHSIDTTTFDSCCSLQMTTHTIESDGNCFFRALSHQLTGFQDGHMVLRELIVDYISINREIYETAVDKQHFRCWDDFIHQMRRSGTFADGITLAASVMFLRRDIIVHQRGQRPLIFKSSFVSTSGRQIHLAYSTSTLHYQTLLSVGSAELHIDEAECISA